MTWDDCVGSGNETDTKDVACANTGTLNIVCSFVSPVDIPNLAAIDWYVDVQVDREASDALSWWFPSPVRNRWGLDITNASGASCPEQLWNRSPTPPVGFGPTATIMGPNRFRLRGTLLFSTGEEQPVQAQVHYYAMTFQLKFSDGTATDPGCQAAASIFTSHAVFLSRDDPNPPDLSSPAVQNITWWRRMVPTPTAKSSWGAIKAIYR